MDSFVKSLNSSLYLNWLSDAGRCLFGLQTGSVSPKLSEILFLLKVGVCSFLCRALKFH